MRLPRCSDPSTELRRNRNRAVALVRWRYFDHRQRLPECQPVDRRRSASEADVRLRRVGEGRQLQFVVPRSRCLENQPRVEPEARRIVVECQLLTERTTHVQQGIERRVEGVSRHVGDQPLPGLEFDRKTVDIATRFELAVDGQRKIRHRHGHDFAAGLCALGGQSDHELPRGSHAVRVGEA